MTEREAIAAVCGASVGIQAVMAAMRDVAKGDKCSAPAGEVLTGITANIERDMQEALQNFYHRALKTELEEILS